MEERLLTTSFLQSSSEHQSASMYEGHTNSRSSSVRLKTWPRIDIISAKDSWSLKHLLGGELFVQLCDPLLPKLEAQPALKV